MADDARAILTEAVKGKSDEEIMEFIGTMGGAETVLEMTFEGMKAALIPDKARTASSATSSPTAARRTRTRSP